jgi:hypothetical protein
MGLSSMKPSSTVLAGARTGSIGGVSRGCHAGSTCRFAGVFKPRMRLSPRLDTREPHGCEGQVCRESPQCASSTARPAGCREVWRPQQDRKSLPEEVAGAGAALAAFSGNKRRRSDAHELRKA